MKKSSTKRNTKKRQRKQENQEDDKHKQWKEALRMQEERGEEMLAMLEEKWLKEEEQLALTYKTCNYCFKPFGCKSCCNIDDYKCDYCWKLKCKNCKKKLNNL